MGEITLLERRIKRVESILIFLTIAAIASGDYLFGPHISLGYLYLVPLSYSALTFRWPGTLGLIAFCVVLRQLFGPVQLASWGLILRDWILTATFLAVVTTLHRLGVARKAFFETARHQRDELLREMKLAADVQEHLLAQHAPPAGLLDVVARTQPLKAVGGDYYDFIPLGEKRLGVVVADVAGKGLPAALIMPAVQIAVRSLAVQHHDLAQTLRELNRVFFETLKPASYVTMFYGVFDVAERNLGYGNAGHQPVLRLRASDGGVEWLSVGGTPIGLLPDRDYETGEVALEPGDVFVLFTDGIVEAWNAAGEEFGQDRLVAVVRESRAAPSESIASAIHAAVDRFRGAAPPADDSTVIVLRIPELDGGGP
jgi:serine phosphatase RsbU (regulator of sigma subunit)